MKRIGKFFVWTIAALSPLGCKSRNSSAYLDASGPMASGTDSPFKFQRKEDASTSRTFNVITVDLTNPNIEVELYQTLTPKKTWVNMNGMKKQKTFTVAVNASFFGVDQGEWRPMGPTVEGNQVLSSYLDPQIESDKYGVFYCLTANDCFVSPLDRFTATLGTSGNKPRLAVTGMSWSIKNGEVHPKGYGIPTRRTVIGLSQDRKTLIMVQGMASYLEVANAALSAGAYNAFNFDGGGSSQMLYRDQIFPEFPKNGPTEDYRTEEEWFEMALRPVPVFLGVKELR
jgi:exopolysaccharide biosynthesis protein